MNGAHELVRFSGPVECRFDRSGPLGLTLIGRDAAGPVQVAFVCAAPTSWPARLDAASVSRADTNRMLVTTGSQELTLDTRGAFVHRDVTRAFERAVPPRRAPLGKRLLWACVLALAASSVGRRVLTR